MHLSIPYYMLSKGLNLAGRILKTGNRDVIGKSSYTSEIKVHKQFIYICQPLLHLMCMRHNIFSEHYFEYTKVKSLKCLLFLVQ